MDTPILPNARDDETPREPRPRYLPRPELIRGIAAVVALIAAVLGLVSQLDRSHPSSAPENQPAIVRIPVPPMTYAGDPVSPLALMPGTSANDPARTVCTDESRPNPRRGHWRCNSWTMLRPRDVARSATWDATPCTHRVVEFAESTAWHCVARVAAVEPPRHPVPNGPPFFGSRLSGNDVCIGEARANPRSGAWHCTLWRFFPVGYSLVQPLEVPGPCSFRSADELTGAWSCRATVGA
jgi:hypothetical protein